MSAANEGQLHRLVRLAVALAGAGLCGVATFGEWKSLAGACIVMCIGLAVQIVAYIAKPNAGLDRQEKAR